MASEHTAKAFDSDLQELTRLVAEMGGLAERSSHPGLHHWPVWLTCQARRGL